ncbi:hypothetical protein NQ315_003369 [Exocentrus adspersus]|uniref:DDE-1 domain-containing protein n=1 Tax=Exocentrus adspersus TaxID=1586481 RepID=A0AAV8VAW1_9CUCU|nr:hypothetical protein NQ315_003369 [Exocentrus adspersus]
MHYGLNRKAALKLTYNFAKSNKIKYPKAWDVGETATKDWLRGFYTRNPNISLRKPEATSFSRSTSFNKNNVDKFYQHLKHIFQEKQIRPEDIWNIDETELTSVHKPKRVLTEKGSKQVGQMTSGERGSLVTMCCSINAIGQTIPPFYIFPRVNFREIMLKGGPTGCKGAAHPSGWMTSEIFLIFFKHFLEYAKPSKERHILVIFDNHDSHIQIDLINLARENNVILLTLPPHSSHKLQPLDVSVCGPLKNYFNSAAESMMLRNPGKPIQIYDIPGLSKGALEKAFTPSNIVSGFKRTGIYPFNENTFTDENFFAAFVTDRNLPEDQTKASSSTLEKVSPPDLPDGPLTSTLITPEKILPFPKAAPRLKSGGRKHGKSRIITQTPEKNEIEVEQLSRKRKKENHNSSDLEFTTNEDRDSETVNIDDKTYNEGDYILVKLKVEGKKESFVHYIGNVISAHPTEASCLKVKYSRSNYWEIKRAKAL